MVIPGWTVVREIPPEVQTGLISGKYQLYGGVIRWASGTENAGQIVKHLVPSPGLIPGGMPNMSIQLEQIIRMVTLTTSLSGLNLAVSYVGFILINAKLNEVDKRLKEIQQDVKDIKHFLDSSERAKLFSALNELLKVNEKMPVEHSHIILHK